MDIMLTTLEGMAPGLGACSLLEYQGRRILLDCGYDDSQPLTGKTPMLPVAAKDINGIVLSHGHLGHCGLLPILVKQGFAGKLYCTSDAQKIAMLSMLEAALMQEEERRYWQAKKPRHVAGPVYTEADVQACAPFFVPCSYHEPINVGKDVAITLFKAGHSPGSSFVRLSFGGPDEIRQVLYVGDMGTSENDLNAETILNGSYDGLLLPACGFKRGDAKETADELAKIINETCKTGGNVVIPAFSIDRRDAVLQILHQLHVNRQIPSLFVFLDSPVASRQVESFPLDADKSERYACIQWVDSVAGSKTVSQIQGTTIIMAGSGRGGHGRIQFHLKQNAPRPESAIVLFGDKAGGALWRAMTKGGGTLSILDEEVQIKAQVHRLGDPGVHVDANAVTEWLKHMKSAPKGVYIAHGKPQARTGFQKTLEKSGVQGVHIPVAGERISL